MNKDNLLDIINANSCLREYCFVDDIGKISSYSLLHIIDENFHRLVGVLYDGNISIPFNLIKSFKITSDRLKRTQNFPSFVGNLSIEACKYLENIDLSNTNITNIFNDGFTNNLSNLVTISNNNSLKSIRNVCGNDTVKIKLQINANIELEYVHTKNIIHNFLINHCKKIKSFNNFDFEIAPKICLFGENLNIDSYDGIEKINNEIIYMVADKIKDFKGVENATTQELQTNSISTPKNILHFMLLTIPSIKFDNMLFSTPKNIIDDNMLKCTKFVNILSKMPNTPNRSEYMMDALMHMLDVADTQESQILY